MLQFHFHHQFQCDFLGCGGRGVHVLVNKWRLASIALNLKVEHFDSCLGTVVLRLGLPLLLLCKISGVELRADFMLCDRLHFFLNRRILAKTFRIPGKKDRLKNLGFFLQCNTQVKSP